MRTIMRAAMLSIAVLCLMAGAAGCTVSVARAAGFWQTTSMDAAAEATVLVSDEDGHGSGVVIAKDRVITAAHVVGEKPTMKITLSDGSTKLGHVIWIGKAENDLALLDVDTGDVRPGHLACRATRRGEPVFAYGYPLAARDVMTWGYVASDVQFDNQGIHGTVLDLTIVPGNSGGGIWSADDGRLVGLAEAVMISPLGMFGVSITHLSVMTPSTAICKLLGRSA